MSPENTARKPTIVLIDDDDDVRDSLQALLETAGLEVRQFASAKQFLAAGKPDSQICLIVDIRMPEMDGLQLQQELKRREIDVPIIIVTGHADVPLAVEAMQAGAIDLLEKPYDDKRLMESVDRALNQLRQAGETRAAALDAMERIGTLTPREREILQLIAAGHQNKAIANQLQISPRTVEVHRARLMDKTGAGSVSDLVRLAIAAGIFAK